VADDPAFALVLAAIGLVGGLALLARGFRSHGTSLRVSDIATSRIATLAAGEVRVTGVVAPAEVTIRSPLQDAECVWYRSRVSRGDRDESGDLWTDERGVCFVVDDGSGRVRVFPRDAVMDVGERFDEATRFDGDEPVGLVRRSDLVFAAGPGGRRYREARLESGDVVTVIGAAIPFGHLGDPAAASVLTVGAVGGDDPEVAADIAEARAAGLLVAPEAAWGNAGIAGFGIGRPVAEPVLHPDATRPALATAAEAAAATERWHLDPDDLVLATGPDGRLLIAAGAPGEVAGRHRDRFLLGLLGAILAIGSALMAGWILVNGMGTLPP
jgi:hypothetical protein